MLPPLSWDEEKFISDDEDSDDLYWTEEALRFGKRLAAALVAMSKSARADSQSTPQPEWTASDQFRLQSEAKIETKLDKVTTQIAKLQEQKGSLEESLANAGGLRQLLYEQGHPLEQAILEALQRLGFTAEPYEDTESEFDAVFTSPEGRCLGEAEGKDNKVINIAKLSQLERNLQEDFARDEVEEFAKGVLFGNAQRLAMLAERKSFFTAKCFSAASRTGIALVRTPNLFEPAKYMKDHSRAKK